MVGIAEIIAIRFPGTRPLIDWAVWSDGTADSIHHWDPGAMGCPMPSEAELAEWAAVPLPPAPDWGTFKSGLLTSADVATIMASARAAGCEPAVSALPVTLEAAQAGRPGEFAACWALVVSAGGASPEALAALAASAEACHLPADFVQALQPLVRARNADGTYAADDPTTPQNEAWALPE